MARKELDCNKETSCVIGSYSETEKSVAKIRLMKTENSSACVTVNWKVCKSERAVLPVVPNCEYTRIRCNKSNRIQNPVCSQ
jgi:predicted RNA-binding Zn-ribbon protein involved in translation (DUF1610 family)